MKFISLIIDNTIYGLMNIVSEILFEVDSVTFATVRIIIVKVIISFKFGYCYELIVMQQLGTHTRTHARTHTHTHVYTHTGNTVCTVNYSNIQYC